MSKRAIKLMSPAQRLSAIAALIEKATDRADESEPIILGDAEALSIYLLAITP